MEASLAPGATTSHSRPQRRFGRVERTPRNTATTTPSRKTRRRHSPLDDVALDRVLGAELGERGTLRGVEAERGRDSRLLVVPLELVVKARLPVVVEQEERQALEETRRDDDVACSLAGRPALCFTPAARGQEDGRGSSRGARLWVPPPLLNRRSLVGPGKHVRRACSDGTCRSAPRKMMRNDHGELIVLVFAGASSCAAVRKARVSARAPWQIATTVGVVGE